MDRETALAAPIATFATWHLSVHCGKCRMIRQIFVRDLPGGTLADVVPRLRCSRCGRPPAGVRLASVQPGMITKVIQVDLLP